MAIIWILNAATASLNYVVMHVEKEIMAAAATVVTVTEIVVMAVIAIVIATAIVIVEDAIVEPI